jgi:hypothetical protein
MAQNPPARLLLPGGLKVAGLFQNRAAIGGFDKSGSDPSGWYWSSSQDRFNSPYVYWGAWDQRFSDGRQLLSDKDTGSSLRCVR